MIFCVIIVISDFSHDAVKKSNNAYSHKTHHCIKELCSNTKKINISIFS